MTKPRILILTHRESLGPIFSSVYVNPAARLSASGFDVRIAAFSTLGQFVKPALRQIWQEFSVEICRRVPGGVVRLPSPPGRLRRLSTDAAVLRGWAEWTFRRWKPDIIHCGASHATCLALDLKRRWPRLKVVSHMWGPEAAELLFGREGDPAALRLADRQDAAQARAMRESDVVISISKAMTRWAQERFGLDVSRTLLIPCFVDAEHFAHEAVARERTRAELRVGGRFVVAYCGSMIGWQLSEKSMDALAALRRVRPDAHFLGLTMHQGSLRSLLSKVGFPEDQTTVLTVPHWDVARYLAAADLGIIGRGLMQGPDVVHAVSSPIKFGEYLACGTPVLMGEGVGDFSALARRHDLGCVLPFHATVSEVKTVLTEFVSRYEADRQGVRARCREVAGRELDIRRHVASLAGAYEGLVSP